MGFVPRVYKTTNGRRRQTGAVVGFCTLQATWCALVQRIHLRVGLEKRIVINRMKQLDHKTADPIPTGMFTRFYIPFILSLLVLTGIFVILTIPPGISGTHGSVFRRTPSIIAGLRSF